MRGHHGAAGHRALSPGGLGVEPAAPPANAYVVATTPRSGSTWLCELLESTGVASAPKEELAGALPAYHGL